MSTRLPLTWTWPWLDELAGLRAGGGPAGAVDDVVEAQLEQAQQVLAGDALLAVGLFVECCGTAARAGRRCSWPSASPAAAARYSLPVLRRRVRPCSPGGYGRRSRALRALVVLEDVGAEAARDAHLGTGVTSHGSDPPPLGRAAAVVRHRGDVLDAGDLDAGVLDASGWRSRDPSPDPSPCTSTLRTPCSMARRAACSAAICAANGVRLARALEADVAGRRPGDDVALGVGDR